VFVDFQYIKRSCICMTKHKILIPCAVLSYKVQGINVCVTVTHNRLLQWSRVILRCCLCFSFTIYHHALHTAWFLLKHFNRIRYGIRYVSCDCLNLCSAKLS
jgi:hypothetical protein